MVWEAVFFLVLLKIPIVYLAFVIWWAVRGEPDEGEPIEVAIVSDTPPAGPGFGRRDRPSRRPSTGRPHGRPASVRRPARTALGART